MNDHVPDIQKTKIGDAAQQAANIVSSIIDQTDLELNSSVGSDGRHIDERGVCIDCTSPIDNAKFMAKALNGEINNAEPLVARHLSLVRDYFQAIIDISTIKAQLNNGYKSQQLLSLVEDYSASAGLNKQHIHESDES